MEANAPEKIYVVIDPVWGSMSVNYNRNDTNNVEYVREDAFIDKACAWLEPVLKNYAGYNVGKDILRDFKNYMMEEKV